MLRNNAWIQTATGRRVEPFNMRVEDVCIQDIAKHLSKLCRFVGATSELYSVAQHSVLVSQNVQRELAMLGLLHDAGEAYLSDIPRPWKNLLFVRSDEANILARSFKDAEDSLLEVILQALGVKPSSFFQKLTPLTARIKHADLTLLVTEARDLMQPLHPDWEFQECNGYQALEEKIIPLGPLAAEHLFLNRYHELKTK